MPVLVIWYDQKPSLSCVYSRAVHSQMFELLARARQKSFVELKKPVLTIVSSMKNSRRAPVKKAYSVESRAKMFTYGSIRESALLSYPLSLLMPK